MARKPASTPTELETLRHPADVTRRNIPTAETSSLMADAEAVAPAMRYPRNPDLDPQLVWRGKDAQDSEPLSVPTVPIYIQEKVKPEALIRDLRRVSKGCESQADLFGDFDRIADPEAELEFYAHAENWSNRMILGDSLLVMNSLAEKEGLRGRVQCIYMDPPYGIRFASNWQPSTRSRDVKEGKAEGLSREPEQIKAFRDTWKDGVHTYLSYLRDRLVVARELLSESGSVFVQIGDENVHRVRGVMDEVFGSNNVVSEIIVQKTTGATSELIPNTIDYLLWFARDKTRVKYRQPYLQKALGGTGATQYNRIELADGIRRSLQESDVQPEGVLGRIFRIDNMTSQRPPGDFPVAINGRTIKPVRGFWKTGPDGMTRLEKARRLELVGNTLCYIRYLEDFPVYSVSNLWVDTVTSGFGADKLYIVQTNPSIAERCLLMTTDPGDLVLDPTCGSGTTAFVAEQWGRRWITVDTSHVALALARTRLMAARHPAYVLRDSREGAAKEGEVSGRAVTEESFQADIRQGFVLERVPHVTLKSIANNAEIDVIHEKWAPVIEAALAGVNAALGTGYAEWEVPRVEKGPNPALSRKREREQILPPLPRLRERVGVRALPLPPSGRRGVSGRRRWTPPSRATRIPSSCTTGRI
jgi:adenine-specific DNA-methyltransferase